MVVSDGQVQGGAPRRDVPVGTVVELTVTSDVADEVHVHGYEIKRPVGAGQTVVVEFTADIPGVFEVELEDHKIKVAELVVGR